MLPRSYQDAVEVLDDAVRPMRAHHICAALGLPVDESKVEGFSLCFNLCLDRFWLLVADKRARARS